MGVLFLGTGQIVPPIIAAPVVGMLFLAADGGFGTAAAVGGPEVDGVHIPLVVHIDNCAAVTGDGLLLNGLRSEALVVSASLDCCRSLFTGDTGHFLRFKERIQIIIHVLLPVDDRVLRARLTLPLGGEGDVTFQLRPKFKRFGIFTIIPAQEIIALPGRSLGCHRTGFGGHEHRGGIGAAVGIEGDPVAGFHLGVQVYVGVRQGNRGNLGVICLLLRIGFRIPADNRLVGIHREGHISRDLITADALFRGADSSVIIVEEYIVDLLELGRVGILFVADGRKLGGVKLDTITEPAGELIALFLRGGGGVDSLARLDLLGAHRFVLGGVVRIAHVGHHEDIGVDGGDGIHDLQGACFAQGFRRHIVDAEGQLLGGLRGEGQGSGAVIIGEDILRVGVHGNSAVHSGQGHFGAGLAGDGDGVDLGVGERHLRTLRGFLLQVTADGVGHIGRLLLGGSLLGGCGGHGDLPDLFLAADRIGDGGIALGYAEDIGNGPASIIDPAQSGSSRVIGIGPGAAGLRGRGQGDGLANRYAAVIGLLFLRLRFRRIGSLSFLFRRIGSLGFLFRRIGSLSFLFRRIGSLSFLFRRIGSLRGLGLHDGRLRLGDYRGGGAEREGVGGA